MPTHASTLPPPLASHTPPTAEPLTAEPAFRSIHSTSFEGARKHGALHDTVVLSLVRPGGVRATRHALLYELVELPDGPLDHVDLAPQVSRAVEEIASVLHAHAHHRLHLVIQSETGADRAPAVAIAVGRHWQESVVHEVDGSRPDPILLALIEHALARRGNNGRITAEWVAATFAAMHTGAAGHSAPATMPAAPLSDRRRPVRAARGTAPAWVNRWLHKPMLSFGLAGAALFTLGVILGLGAIWVRVVNGIGYRPLLQLVQLCVELGAMSFGFGLLSEQIAQHGEQTRAMHDEFRHGRAADASRAALDRLTAHAQSSGEYDAPAALTTADERTTEREP